MRGIAGKSQRPVLSPPGGWRIVRSIPTAYEATENVIELTSDAEADDVSKDVAARPKSCPSQSRLESEFFRNLLRRGPHFLPLGGFCLERKGVC